MVRKFDECVFGAANAALMGAEQLGSALLKGLVRALKGAGYEIKTRPLGAVRLYECRREDCACHPAQLGPVRAVVSTAVLEGPAEGLEVAAYTLVAAGMRACPKGGTLEAGIEIPVDEEAQRVYGMRMANAIRLLCEGFFIPLEGREDRQTPPYEALQERLESFPQDYMREVKWVEAEGVVLPPDLKEPPRLLEEEDELTFLLPGPLPLEVGVAGDDRAAWLYLEGARFSSLNRGADEVYRALLSAVRAYLRAAATRRGGCWDRPSEAAWYWRFMRALEESGAEEGEE